MYSLIKFGNLFIVKTMKNINELYEQLAKTRAKLYDAEFALLRCKSYAKAYKENALPVSRAGFEDIEKVATEAEKAID